MQTLIIVFWVLAAIIFYTYLGYGIVLFVMVKLKRVFRKSDKIMLNDNELPEVTLLVAAYNEQDYVHKKVENSMSLIYPKGKLRLVWVTVVFG